MRARSAREPAAVGDRPEALESPGSGPEKGLPQTTAPVQHGALLPLARIVKSVRNRAHIRAMRGRGAVTRLLWPGVLKGGGGLQVGRGVGIVIYGELIVGRNVTLADGCALEIGPEGRIELGDDVFVGRHSVIVSQKLVVLGNRTLVAEHCTIRDQDHHVDPSERLNETRHQTSPVHIGDNVWLGAGVRVLRGSRVGEGSVIAANAVVRGEIPARVVAAGVPARVLGGAERPPADSLT